MWHYVYVIVTSSVTDWKETENVDGNPVMPLLDFGYEHADMQGADCWLGGGAVFACDSNIRFRFGDTHFTDSKLTVINWEIILSN